MKRVFLIVLDSLGIGQMPDSTDFGDSLCNTLKTISKSKEFKIPNLLKMGIGNIESIDFLEKEPTPTATVARIKETSRGKDTTIGHWEIAGVISNNPLPTYPNGFPKEIISEFSKKTGREVICNLPYSGTKVLEDYGEEHLKNGSLIVYTSADSVFQIAAHEEVVPVEKLYEYCRIAREILRDEHAVGRVIARPFVGGVGNFKRTANRRDFSLLPPSKTMLDALKENGKTVLAVGKINDIFCGCGISESFKTHSNTEGMEITKQLLNKDFEGLCFVNLVDFDMLYGHRQDIDGYAKALSEFDEFLSHFTSNMKADDLLIITADHGCDPGDNSTDHTREYVLMLAYKKGIVPENLGTLNTFADISKTVCDYFEVPFKTLGKSFLNALRSENNE